MISAELTVNLKNHEALRAHLDKGTGPVKDVMLGWERKYRNFVVRRFDRYSRGGGDWRPNSLLTILMKRSTAILVDTREMRLGLALGIRAIRVTQDSVTFAFVNETEHSRARIPIAELLTRHDKGIGVPKRAILVAPDDDAAAELVASATKRYAEFANEGL